MGRNGGWGVFRMSRWWEVVSGGGCEGVQVWRAGCRLQSLQSERASQLHGLWAWAGAPSRDLPSPFCLRAPSAPGGRWKGMSHTSRSTAPGLSTPGQCSNCDPHKRGDLKQLILLLKIVWPKGDQRGLAHPVVFFLLSVPYLMGVPSFQFSSFPPFLPPPSHSPHPIPIPKVQLQCCRQEAAPDPHRISGSTSPSLGLPRHCCTLSKQPLQLHFALKWEKARSLEIAALALNIATLGHRCYF